MNLHQFRFTQEAVRQKLNLTEAAKILHTSQPGVSKAIIELEEELGVDIFTRHGKRLRNITEPGQKVLQSIDIIMREVQNLKSIGDQYSNGDSGTLSIATTHTQARYVLPQAITKLRQHYPKVNIVLHQGSPKQVTQMLIDEVAEIGIATEAVAANDKLITLPCYEWQHVLIVPSTHPWSSRTDRLTLQELALEPLVTYHPSFTGRSKIDATFKQHGLNVRIALEAIDADVIKTYVRSGFGIGIVSEVAIREDTSSDLVSIPLGHLFGQQITRIAFKRGVYLRQFVLHLAEFLSDRLDRKLVMQALKGDSSNYEL